LPGIGVVARLLRAGAVGGLVGAAADDGAETGEDFLQIERLHDVIIRAGVEALHAVARLVAGGEHEHGRLFGFAQALEDFPAVHARQHHVEDDGVVVRALGVEETVIAVVGGVHGVTFLAQRLGEAREQIGFVFDNQDSHNGARQF